MVLERRMIASLTEWSCGSDRHNNDDRLLIITDWGETLVVKPWCEQQHESGTFVLDEECMPENLLSYLETQRKVQHGTTEGVRPLVFVRNSTTTYGRGLFRVELTIALNGVLLRLESNGCIGRIRRISATSRGCVSSNFSFNVMKS